MEPTKDKKKNGAVDAAVQAEEFPNTVAELHVLTWRLHGERLEKLAAQMMLLQKQGETFHVEQQKTEAALNAHKLKMRLVYGLEDADRVDMETGAITRAPKPQKAPEVN